MLFGPFRFVAAASSDALALLSLCHCSPGLGLALADLGAGMGTLNSFLAFIALLALSAACSISAAMILAWISLGLSFFFRPIASLHCLNYSRNPSHS